MRRSIDFWKRELGAFWLPFERQKIVEYSKVKSNERISISGYVKWISNSSFALVPTLFSNQIYLLCSNNTGRRPRENSYISISGTTRWSGLKSSQAYSTLYDGTLLVEVDGWKDSKPDFNIPKEEFGFDDFRRNLTSRIEGLEPKIVDFLAFTAISTPTLRARPGGVNITLYDSTESGLPRHVIRELQRGIPKGMGKLCTIDTRLGKFGMRYKYTYFTEDADKPLSKVAQAFLTHEASIFSEASLSLFSKKDRPLTIEDPPCSLSDIPTVVPEETTILRERPRIDQFDALKYIITSHMKTPILQNFEKSSTMIVNSLEKLTDSWGLDPDHLTSYGFLNANYYARPASVLRESLAYARAQNIGTIDVSLVSKTFEEYFKWNFKYVYEIWEDLLENPVFGEKTLLSLRVKYRDIIRAIRKNQSTDKPGVSREVLLGEVKKSNVHTDALVVDCVRDGVIYEPVKGFYKLTRELQ